MQHRKWGRMLLAQPGKSRGSMGTGLGLVHQDSAGRVVGRVSNRTDPFLQSIPGLLAGYPVLLLILKVTNYCLTNIVVWEKRSMRIQTHILFAPQDTLIM